MCSRLDVGPPIARATPIQAYFKAKLRLNPSLQRLPPPRGLAPLELLELELLPVSPLERAELRALAKARAWAVAFCCCVSRLKSNARCGPEAPAADRVVCCRIMFSNASMR